MRKEDLSDEEVGRLRTIAVELDQCWDLLRGLRDADADPNVAKVRPANIVENYKQ